MFAAAAMHLVGNQSHKQQVRLLFCSSSRPMIDTHCHIHFRAYKDNMNEVLERTRARGVKMITIGTQTSTSKEAVEIASAHPDIWCTVGLHPSHTHAHTLHTDQNEAIQTRAETFDQDYYRSLITSSSKVVAIGEVGLDYYRLPEEGAADVIEAQKRELWKAIELATETDLPLVLHIRDAHADMLEIIRQAQSKQMMGKGAVVHCFTGTTQEAQAYHALGIYTSFTGILTFKDKKHPERLTPLMETLQSIDLSWVLIETDAPYLTPHPHRGEQNEPWMVRFVAEKIAELKGLTLEEVDRITTDNAQRLFGITV